jgi:hypothetical protein
VRRERQAVSALFATNGALFATVLPRLPEIKADLGLSDGQLGLALLGLGLGGLSGSTASGGCCRAPAPVGWRSERRSCWPCWCP